MFVAEPAAPAASPPMMVLRVDTRSDVIASRDTPLALAKAGRAEDALLRQAVVVTATLKLVRATAATTVTATATDAGARIEAPDAPYGAGPATADVLRWTYASYLQRQVCFTSITGLFACAAAEVEPLPERFEGETRVTDAPPGDTSNLAAPNATAEAARTALATTLRARASLLFETDRRLKLVPMLRAAGVVERTR
jgi:hypothetical protein